MSDENNEAKTNITETHVKLFEDLTEGPSTFALVSTKFQGVDAVAIALVKGVTAGGWELAPVAILIQGYEARIHSEYFTEKLAEPQDLQNEGYSINDELVDQLGEPGGAGGPGGPADQGDYAVAELAKALGIDPSRLLSGSS